MTEERESLFSVPDLPICPYCGSTHVKSFDPDWIQAPAGSMECVECGNAFVPSAWPKLNRAQRRAAKHGEGIHSQLDHGPRQGG